VFGVDSETKYCECGCGSILSPVPVRGKPRRFIKNHHRPQKGKPHKQETKDKISKANTGKIRTQEMKDKLSKAFRGEKHPLWGKHHSEKARAKISLARRGRKLPEIWCEHISKSRIGDKNHNWKGGTSRLPYDQSWTNALKETIRQRDGYICQLCSIKQEARKEKLHVHHIDYIKENCKPNNLISLCMPCHMKTNYHRNKWMNIFKNKIDIVYDGTLAN
jgi:5-methylcytosine-specific restriction endonuclease McrA